MKRIFLIIFLAALAHAQTTNAPDQNIYAGTCFQAVTCGPFLASLTVAPANPSINALSTLQMQSEGVESDGTDGGAYGPQCDGNWSSTNNSVATVAAQGLVTAVAAGTATISCTLKSGITGYTVVTVLPLPQISNPSCSSPPCVLPAGSNGTAYSFTFSATPTGGSWSVTTGSLPGWATLNSSTGALTGTPNATGTTNFTVTYTDSGTASVAVALTINASSGCSVLTNPCASTSLSTITYPSSAPSVGNAISGVGAVYTDPLCGLLGSCTPSTGVRVTDGVHTDPSMITNTNDVFTPSNGGDSGDAWWSTDDTLLLAGEGGSRKVLIALNPSTLAVSRPYSTVTSGCPAGTGNCSQQGGWAIGPDPLEFSRTNSCKLYDYPTSASVYSYTFGSDVSASNSCSGSISGPPAPVLVENFIQANGNCLPANFGAPTWTSDAGSVDSDAYFGMAFSSSAYHYGSSTGQGSGYYLAIYSPTKGCLAYNTATGAITADPGWSGGSGLTCTGSGCTGTSTATGLFTIHNVKFNNNGAFIVIAQTTCISGTCGTSNPWVWQIGTTNVYLAQDATKTSGHWCNGYPGYINNPGTPLWADWYRTEGSTAPGTPVQLTLLPSPAPTQNLDQHCGWLMDNTSDQYPFSWASTSATLSNSGGGETPFDEPQGPWWNEVDFTASYSGGNQGCSASGANCPTYREGLTFNTEQEDIFNAAQNILACSKDGKFCAFGSGWYNLRNAGGTQAGCGVNQMCSSSNCIPSGPYWAASKSYPAYYVTTPNKSLGNSGSYSYQVASSCTSGSSFTGTWNQTVGGATADGTCTWTNIGLSSGANRCGTDEYVLRLE